MSNGRSLTGLVKKSDVLTSTAAKQTKLTSPSKTNPSIQNIEGALIITGHVAIKNVTQHQPNVDVLTAQTEQFGGLTDQFKKYSPPKQHGCFANFIRLFSCCLPSQHQRQDELHEPLLKKP